jgi:putative redox protein
VSPDPLIVDIEQVGASELRGTARTHHAAIDRPIPKGGTDHGPLGGEYMLLALGGCFLSTMLAAARARDIQLSGTTVAVTGTIAESPPRFSAIEMRVRASHADRSLLRKLIAIAEQSCIVTNTLKPGVPISVDLEPLLP